VLDVSPALPGTTSLLTRSVEGRDDDAVPQPGKDDASGLAEAGRDVDELRTTVGTRRESCRAFRIGLSTACEAALVAKGLEIRVFRIAEGCPEELVKSRAAHVSANPRASCGRKAV